MCSSDLFPSHDKTIDKIAEYLNTKPDLTLDDIYFNYRITRNDVDITKIVTGVSSGSFKDLLKGIQNPGRDTYINVMGSRDVTWNATENREWHPVKDSREHHETKQGAFIRLPGKKEQVFLEYFDEYVNTRNCTMVQDPTTGVITVTGYTDDPEDRDEDTSKFVFVLEPEILKRYTMAF